MLNADLMGVALKQLAKKITTKQAGKKKLLSGYSVIETIEKESVIENAAIHHFYEVRFCSDILGYPSKYL